MKLQRSMALFFVSGSCARLIWPSRQLLSARKSTVSYRNGVKEGKHCVVRARNYCHNHFV